MRHARLEEQSPRVAKAFSRVSKTTKDGRVEELGVSNKKYIASTCNIYIYMHTNTHTFQYIAYSFFDRNY